MDFIYCEYGCGNKAEYFLKRAKRWCCSKSFNSCPENKRKNRESNLGSNNHMHGKKHTDECKRKISKANKGNIPWNKNLTNCYSNEAISKMKNCKKGKIPWNKGKTNIYSEETKRRISESLKGSIPWNKGVSCSDVTKEKISKKIKAKGIK